MRWSNGSFFFQRPDWTIWPELRRNICLIAKYRYFSESRKKERKRGVRRWWLGPSGFVLKTALVLRHGLGDLLGRQHVHWRVCSPPVSAMWKAQLKQERSANNNGNKTARLPPSSPLASPQLQCLLSPILSCPQFWPGSFWFFPSLCLVHFYSFFCGIVNSSSLSPSWPWPSTCLPDKLCWVSRISVTSHLP